MASSRKKTRFLNYDEIDASIEEVLELARQQSVHIALAGGAAMQVWGSDRFTKDVDFVANEELRDLEIVGPLGFGGIQGKTTSGVPVDVIVRDDQYGPLYEAALRFAARVQDLPIRVVSAEYMVALKLAAARDKDILDLQYLLVEHKDLDYAKARAIVREFLGPFAADELDRYLAEFQWTVEQERNPPKRR